MYAVPVLVDIDGDGDLDVFIGSYDGTVYYYQNTGLPNAPVYTSRTGGANPLNNVNVNIAAVPTFGDIDGDGKIDVFIGGQDGAVRYYKNTGTVSAPVFTQQTGGANPLNGVDVGYYAAPSLVDIDGDGNLDIFIGEGFGTMVYYKNTGSHTVPAFTIQTGAANPLNGVDIGTEPILAFVDIDKDGDKDVFIGAQNGTINYYMNTGTAIAPVLTVQTGAANPFNGVNVGNLAAPGVGDINGDTKMDVFIGNRNGDISYYQNSSVLPLTLLGFSGSSQAGYNQLQWQTAGEVNTQQFGLESSSDGIHFNATATVNAAGSGNNKYSYQDKTVYKGKVFYRLKMTDIDGRYTYSGIIWISSQQNIGVSIYPNPARDVVNINTGSAALLHTNALLLNANGSLLQTILITASQQQINVQSLAPGVYMLKFADGAILSFIKK